MPDAVPGSVILTKPYDDDALAEAIRSAGARAQSAPAAAQTAGQKTDAD